MPKEVMPVVMPEVEIEIMRDMFYFLRDYNDPPATRLRTPWHFRLCGMNAFLWLKNVPLTRSDHSDEVSPVRRADRPYSAK